MKKTLEVACFDYESALIAAQNGAHRIEYCHDYSMGGKTPDVESTKKLLACVNIPVFVMLRIGSGFHFHQHEFDLYRAHINAFKAIGVHGFVIGFLDRQNEIDLDFNQRLLDLIHPLPCTFHRAIDYTSNYMQSVEHVIAMGFNRILTSGGPGNAHEFAHNLTNAQLNYGKQIAILPGGGIRSHNIRSLVQKTGCTEYHTAALIDNKINPTEIRQLLSELN